MTYITDENTNTMNTISSIGNIRTNMTTTTNNMSICQRQRQRHHPSRSRSRSPIRPESRRRINNSSNQRNLEPKQEARNEEEEHCQLTVQSCVSFGGPVVSDEEDDDDDNEDEVECSLMDTSMEVDVIDDVNDDVVAVISDDSCDDDDDDVDMQVEEQDNHDACNVINLLSFETETTTVAVAQPLKSHRTVSFGSVFTREYSVTVGDHPCSNDSVGLTLDWGYAAEYAVPVEHLDWTQVPIAFWEQGQQQFSYNTNKNSPRRRIRRLSASERRKRVCSVTGCLPSDVRAAEYNMALQRYNQELTEVMMRRNRMAEVHKHETPQDPQDAANESRRLLQHQQHLEVLYASFKDVQYQQEQEYSQYVQRHRQQQGHRQQQRQQERRQLRQSRSKRAATEAASATA